MIQDSDQLTGTFVWYTGSHEAKNLWSFDSILNVPIKKLAVIVPVRGSSDITFGIWAAIIPGQEVFYFTEEKLAKLHIEIHFGLK